MVLERFWKSRRRGCHHRSGRRRAGRLGGRRSQGVLDRSEAGHGGWRGRGRRCRCSILHTGNVVQEFFVLRAGNDYRHRDRYVRHRSQVRRKNQYRRRQRWWGNRSAPTSAGRNRNDHHGHRRNDYVNDRADRHGRHDYDNDGPDRHGRDNGSRAGSTRARPTGPRAGSTRANTRATGSRSRPAGARATRSRARSTRTVA